MPPKKKTTAKAAAPKAAAKRKAPAKKKGRGGKKAKEEEPEESEEEEAAPATAEDFVAKLKAADKGKTCQAKPDSQVPLMSPMVVDDFDCMLNQTNIGHNNNKYYIIQVLQQGFSYYAWNRWGRVGETGANSLKGPFINKADAVKDFEKKFRDKTKNSWAARNDFQPIPGKYTMLEMDAEEDDDGATAEMAAKLDEIDGVARVVKECSLDKQTQSLVKMIFDNDMFKEAMKQMDIDVKKMPLGKLSKTQIAKGFEVLDEIEKTLKGERKNNLTELSSRFYTLIPHDFGRQRPPAMGDLETVRKKMDMLLVLGDIELAQAMQKDKGKKATADETTEVPHPLDQNYDLLQCDLDLLPKASKDFKVIQNYIKATEGYRKVVLQDVWKVDRNGEEDRFSVHETLGNRKLLWHGTNMAVVAAILKGGLRIMPHSGGRVGKGIYFASENGKSAGYVRCTADHTGIMFLNEVALGKEHHITRDDWRLNKAPNGYDSIVAKGHTEPDPSKDTTLVIEGNKVVVPQGKPIRQAKFSGSSFSQSEYLVYKESQNCLRYLLKLKFT